MRPKGVADGQQVNIPALRMEGLHLSGDANAKAGSPLVVAIGDLLPIGR